MNNIYKYVYKEFKSVLHIILLSFTHILYKKNSIYIPWQ